MFVKILIVMDVKNIIINFFYNIIINFFYNIIIIMNIPFFIILGLSLLMLILGFIYIHRNSKPKEYFQLFSNNKSNKNSYCNG